MRKGLIWCATLTVAATLAQGGADAQTSPAQNWPAKSIRLIVPYPPGGLSDVFARLIGDKLARVLGQAVVIDNRPGGNTIIGTQATAQSPPDGYTLLLTNGGSASTRAWSPACPMISTGISPRWSGSARATASSSSTTRCRRRPFPS